MKKQWNAPELKKLDVNNSSGPNNDGIDSTTSIAN